MDTLYDKFLIYQISELVEVMIMNSFVGDTDS